MKNEPFDIVGSYNQQRYLSLDSERTINMFEYLSDKGKYPKILVPTSGLRSVGLNLDDYNKGFRKSVAYKDKMYHVIGDSLVVVSEDLVFEFLYTLDTEEGYVGAASNNNDEIMFVDGVNGYVVDYNTGLVTKITRFINSTPPPDSVFFPENPIDIASLDGFLVVIDGASSSFQLSALNAATDWSVNQLGTIYEGTSNLIAVRTLHGRLFFFKTDSTSIWYNAGIGSNLPFRPLKNLSMDFGTVNAWNVVSDFDRIIFLSQAEGGLGPVMQIKGSEVIPISTSALDYEFQTYASDHARGVSDATGIMIKENGIIFYRINFTAANKTFVLNVTQSQPNYLMWHEEEMLNGDRHVAQTHVYFFGKNYYGHYNEGKFYQVSPNFITNDGELIRQARITMPKDMLTRIRVDRLHVDFLQGEVIQEDILVNAVLGTENGFTLGTENGDAIGITFYDQPGILNNPEVFLSISRDGGHTFGPRLKASLGKVGQYSFWTVWRKLGTSNRGESLVFKLEHYQKVPFVIFGAQWWYSELPQ